MTFWVGPPSVTASLAASVISVKMANTTPRFRNCLSLSDVALESWNSLSADFRSTCLVEQTFVCVLDSLGCRYGGAACLSLR